MMTLFIVMISAYAAGALGALLIGRGALGRGLAALGACAGSAAGLTLGMSAIVAGRSFTLASARVMPVAGLMTRLDGLSAFFLVIIGLLGLAVAIYGYGYSASYERRYSLRMLGAMLNTLLLSLSLQVVADNALTFLISWELMSLAAYWLVLTEHDGAETVRAAVWYIAMTHAGFAALMAMFLLMSGGDLTTSFAAMRGERGGAFAGDAQRDLCLGALRLRNEGGDCSLARLAADGASGRAQPRFGADVWRSDQDRHLRPGASRARPAGRRAGVVGRRGAGHRRDFGVARRALRADGT